MGNNREETRKKSIAMPLRLSADAALLISVFIMPWWIFVLFCVVFVFYFKNYYEVLVAALIFDSLYGASLPQILNFNFMFSLFAIFLIILSLYLKSRIRMYN